MLASLAVGAELARNLANRALIMLARARLTVRCSVQVVPAGAPCRTDLAL
jgi:hypothetical protein